MQRSVISVLLACVAGSTACTIPTDTLPNTLDYLFGILIQNPAYPVIHDRYMNLDPAGGGDNHLFLDPVGNPTFNLDINGGVLEQGIIHAVIDGEYSAVDNTTKMFMTNRGDPKAIFQPVYGCDPDTDALQVQLAFQTCEDSPYGGSICVRVASGNRGYEFRYSPPNNPAFDPTNPCMPVTMVVVQGNASSSTSVSSSSPSTVASSSSTSTPPVGTTASSSLGSTTSSTSSSAQSTPTGPVINGIWSYYGCQTEATNMRALSLATTAADTMTLEACAVFCKNYQLFGTEYARECYCGNSFNAGSVRAPETDCNFKCMGNAQEICGAGLRLSVYTKGAVLPPSSSSSTSSSSSLSTSIPSSTQPSSSSTSSSTSSSVPPASSSTTSSSSSSPSSSSSSTGVPSTSTSSSSSSLSTTSSSATSSSTATTLSTQTSSSSTSSKSSSSSSTAPTVSISPLPYTDMTSFGFAFVGCAPEERRATDGPGRTLTGPLYADDLMTNGKCMTYCSTNGYPFAGTEYTRECWCGNTVAPGRQPQTTVASLAGCNFKCGGDATQYCGGDAWLSLYKACPAGGPCVNQQFT